jgi:hypothetical protein
MQSLLELFHFPPQSAANPLWAPPIGAEKKIPVRLRRGEAIAA